LPDARGFIVGEGPVDLSDTMLELYNASQRAVAVMSSGAIDLE
jgi:hypothetical protein